MKFISLKRRKTGEKSDIKSFSNIIEKQNLKIIFYYYRETKKNYIYVQIVCR